LRLTSSFLRYILKIYMTHRRLLLQIRQLRLKQGLTQAELAKRADLSWIYIAKLEGGDRISPSLPALDRIAHALGATLRIQLIP